MSFSLRDRALKTRQSKSEADEPYFRVTIMSPTFCDQLSNSYIAAEYSTEHKSPCSSLSLKRYKLIV